VKHRIPVTPAARRTVGAGLNALIWLSLAAASPLPDILLSSIVGYVPRVTILASLALLAALLVLAFALRPLRPLRLWFGALALLAAGNYAVSHVMALTVYRAWELCAGFAAALAAFQGLKLIVTALIAALLLIATRSRRAAYLHAGTLDAPARTLGMPDFPARSTWRTFGPVMAVLVTAATCAFFLLGARLPAAPLARVLPWVLAAVVLAALNAFSEEVQFRSGLLAPLVPLAGYRQALWMAPLYFGLAHYFGGTPGGWPGVAITFVLGWLFSKAALDTGGIGWSWFLHWLQNAVIYSLWAVAAAGAG